MRHRSLNVLHAIHDFLPRHQAGSEIYASNLCKELQKRCHITVFCADYDPGRTHGSLTWRVYDGLPVVELANNWECSTLAETYRPPLVGQRIAQVLDAVQPDIVHVHNLLNLSFDLPALARARAIPVVATLHDYTLVCASGGQRLHIAEQHVCDTIDTDRCARCFQQSPFYDQMTIGRVATAVQAARPLQRLARWASRVLPPSVVSRTAGMVGQAAGPTITPSDISQRLDAARSVFDDIDLFVAPSASLAEEYRRLGIDAAKLRVSDYGFPALATANRLSRSDRLRIGYVGSIVWHKGLHVLVESARRLPASGWEMKIFGNLAVSPVYAKMLQRSSEGLPISFEGDFSRDEVSHVFSQIDVLVVPSLWLENSPLVIHEAFMAGIPVVGSRIGGTADLVSDGVNGLLYKPTSPAALGGALKELIDNPARIRTLANRIPEVKTILRDAEEWEDIYSQVLENSGTDT